MNRADLTTEAIVSADAGGSARVIARQDAVLAGTEPFTVAFRELDHDATVELSAKDGDLVRPGDVVAIVGGSLRAILTAERTALNFLHAAVRRRDAHASIRGSGRRHRGP